MEKIRLQVYRYNPDVDAKPYMKDYELEIEPTDVKLLDAIIKLKAQDDSLSFRRSCTSPTPPHCLGPARCPVE